MRRTGSNIRLYKNSRVSILERNHRPNREEFRRIVHNYQPEFDCNDFVAQHFVRILNAEAPIVQEHTAGIIAVKSSDAQITAPWKKYIVET